MGLSNYYSNNTILLLAAAVAVIVYSASSVPRAYPYRPPVGIPPGNLELSYEYCRRLMRFTKHEIRVLVSALKIDEIVYRSRLKPPPEIALCLLLSRLSYPIRLFSMTQIFHRSESYISTVYNNRDVVAWHPMLNNPKKLRRYVARQLGLPQTAIWGFVDSTFRGVYRPQRQQEKIYSGYKKEYRVKWQGYT